MERQQLGERLWDLRANLLRLALSITQNAHDAEDAVSAAMVKALQQAEALRKPDCLKPWAMRITARCCYDQLRRRKRETPVECVPETPVLQSDGELYGLLLSLPAIYAQVLILYYYEGFSTQEMAAVLRLPRPAVSMRLSRGRKMLKDCLEKEAAEDESI